MSIEKGKIKNINKKLIAGILSFSLVSSTIVGCSVLKKIESERARYENFEGVASFNKLKKCYFIGVKNSAGEINFYIAEKIEGSNENSYLYLNLLDGRNVYVTKDLSDYNVNTNQEIVVETKIEDYLYNLKMIETVYSKEDINNLLEQMKQLNNFSNKSK